MEEFRVIWSHTYYCFRGGNQHLKPEVKNPLKHHNVPGSRRCGCPGEMLYFNALFCLLLWLT